MLTVIGAKVHKVRDLPRGKAVIQEQRTAWEEKSNG